MRINAKNFGPLHNVDIEIKPMTVVIGKNNLGKSFLAQLIYVVLNTLRELPFRVNYYYRWIAPEEERDSMKANLKTLVVRIKKEKTSETQIINEVARIALSRNEDLLGKMIQVGLERAFGPDINRLINITASSATVCCDAFKYVTLSIMLKRDEQVKASLQVSKEVVESMATRHRETINRVLQKRQKLRYVEILLMELLRDLTALKEELPEILLSKSGRTGQSAYYVPAGRGGLIESFDTVVDSLFYDAATAPAQGISMAPLPGMAAQFYVVLRSLEGNKGPLKREVVNLFKELLGGDIRLQPVKLVRGLRPLRKRMIYHFQLGNKTSTTDVTRAASMIKEIAPIYLIVQELVYPHQFLIIEEPESHLHPGAQSKLTRIFATLVNNEVNVLLTTHSTILVRGIAHFIGRLPGESRPVLKRESVALYWLKEGKRGSTSKPIKISRNGTLDEIPTFDEAIKELYEEEEALSRQVRSEETRAKRMG